ncbi:hypothetical protein ACE6H2_007565 [Prunus campanulata]
MLWCVLLPHVCFTFKKKTVLLHQYLSLKLLYCKSLILWILLAFKNAVLLALLSYISFAYISFCSLFQNHEPTNAFVCIYPFLLFVENRNCIAENGMCNANNRNMNNLFYILGGFQSDSLSPNMF